MLGIWSQPKYVINRPVQRKRLLDLRLVGTIFVLGAILSLASFNHKPANRIGGQDTVSSPVITIPIQIPTSRALSGNDALAVSQTYSDPNRQSPPATSAITGIITTIFWAGEPADQSNGYIANAASAWDGNWEKHYGGYDDPGNRNGYFPSAFTPKENPFYAALPYNDLDANGGRKITALSCLNSNDPAYTDYSWCKNTWIEIRHGTKTVYAQWEDVGPFLEDDYSYVFGGQPPANTTGEKAGLDVSPAVRDYLDLSDVDTTTWRLVPTSQVPNGPWKQIITTSKGYSAN
jgi:hypothetical protein